MKADAGQRIYYMDAMRSVLMMLGVLMHSTQVFNAHRVWLVQYPSQFQWANAFIDMFHLFRMPVFFVVSGFFCAMTLQKYGAIKFLKIRLVRIVLPLTVVALSLNSLQMYVLVHSTAKPFDLGDYLIHGLWVSHLWFLIVLIFYFLSAFLIHWRLSSSAKTRLTAFNQKWPLTFWWGILLFPVWQYGILALGTLGVPIYEARLGLPELYTILHYAPFFAVGYWFFHHRQLMVQFMSCPLWLLVVATFSIWGIQWALKGYPSLSYGLDQYLFILKTWLAVAICFSLFHRFANKKSTLFLFLSDASYTVYLLHHATVIFLALLFWHFALPSFVAWPLIILGTLSITLCLHKYVVLKVPMLRFLLNGKSN